MSRFRVLDTDHSAFTVSDMDRSLKIFRDLVACEVMSDDLASADVVHTLTGIDAAVRVVYLRAPGGRVFELLEYQGPADKEQVRSRPCDTGAAHWAFRVDDVEAAVEEGLKAGLTLYNRIVRIDNEGVRSAYMRDPDGLTIEFISRSGA